jgi:aromatic ring-opening dioxygenase catalytic subunit (LigB family)
MVGKRMPVAFVPHGGGPWPFVDMGGFMSQREIEALRSYLVNLPNQLPSRPRALLVISAHWEEASPTVMTSAAPPIYYDYGGFPPEAYTIQWPAPGDPKLAGRVVALLEAAGIPAKTDTRRGFDHGTFIPFKVSWPDADIPTIQLSIKSNYDPADHLAIGQALAPLRDEGILILGSGMSFHSFRSFRMGTARKDSQLFDAWLREAATAAPEMRTTFLRGWSEAPGARLAHPQEDHLIPLMVIAGAAGADVGRVTFSEEFAGARISAFQFG